MDDTDRWRRIEEVFHDALEQTESAREAWIDFTCGDDTELSAEVKSLLDSDRASGGAFIGSKVERAVVQLDADIQTAAEGQNVGPYRLLRQLGRGGMGAVYLAARDDQQYESEVAIKVVRPGLDTDFILRRFRRERQILARLQHPNIARLLDGGTTEDGMPYLVMEYIQGSWITRYAAQHDLNVEERLRLFLPVCAAVEYAHRHFIVHRDLKPANILIDQSGVPKLLDFGISKLLHSDGADSGETQPVALMTPDYASPEQIVGDSVTILSDVYSLGAVLYELLSRARPHQIEQCTPLAIERAICLDETIAPSAAVRENRTLARRLTGDLDNIVLRAMQKDPERRYLSVEQVADDIRRHLDHRPVVARADSLAYRAGKFFRRNRVSLTVASVAGASLIGGAAVAVREARIAQERFDDVRRLAGTFVMDVEQATRDLPGSIGARQLIARTGLEYLRKLARSSPSDWALKRDLATAYIRIGELQGGGDTSNLGQPAEALKSFENAQTLLDAVLKQSPGDGKAALERMTLAHRLSNVHRQTGNTSLAVQSSEDGLRRAEALLVSQPGDAEVIQYAAVFHLDLGRMRQQSGDLGRAADDVTSGIRLLKQLSAARPEHREMLSNLASSHARLGSIHAELGDRQAALDSYRAGVSVLESLVQRFPNDTHSRHELMLAYSHVGDVLGNSAYDNFGDEAGARAAYARMAEIAASLQAADRSDVRAMSDHGIALLRLGIVTPVKKKRTALRKAYEFLERAATQNPEDRPTAVHKAWAETELGDAALSEGDRSSAVRSYRTAIATAEAAQVPDAPGSSERWLVAAAQKLATEQARSGDRTAALITLEKLIEVGRRAEPQTQRSLTIGAIAARAWQATGFVYAMLARAGRGEQQQRDRESAREWYARSLAQWRKLEPQNGFNTPFRKDLSAAIAELAALDARTRGSR